MKFDLYIYGGHLEYANKGKYYTILIYFIDSIVVENLAIDTNFILLSVVGQKL